VNQLSKIGKYDILSILGRGGMGVVYKATDPRLDRLVAIKMMTVGYAEDPELLKRFYREAQSTASLQHPNIVTVYDTGDQDGSPYLVMEFLEGESLDAILTSRRLLGAAEKVQYVMDACRGLSYAHGRGIVHRDIKPGNIMVLKDGSAKLVDFGIAHVASNTLTRTGQIMGSVNYMSPEQIHGRAVDARTDIFSLGVVLYQLFTNSLPFEGDSSASTLLKIIHEPPPPMAEFLAGHPKELESIILRALAKNRDERYQTADELALDLLQVYEQLKQDLVTRHLREAEDAWGKGNWKQARAWLQQLLKLDQKHTTAIRLMRQVQQTIEKEEAGAMARQLKASAEESFSRGEFDAALQYLDQAAANETLAPEMADFYQRVKEAKVKGEELQRVLHRAEEAHERGDLEAAKQAADEALEINSDDTQAKALYRLIHRDWVERSRQRQLEALLQDARKEVSARNLTAAVGILKRAEALDPQGTQVRALLDEIAAEREQERQRQELARISHEVEEALNHDDFQTAAAKLEEGLRQFPQDRTLAQLKALADRQRAAAERKNFISQQIAAARQLLDASQAEEALTLLQSAVKKAPREPQLETLLAMVQELVTRNEQERRRKELERIGRQVDEALSREDYDAALAEIADGLRAFPGERSLAQLKELAEKQRVDAEQKAFIREQIAAARQLLDADQAIKAQTLLQTALRRVPQEPQLEALLTMVEERVARDAAEKAKNLSIQQAREALGKNAFGEAVRILEAAQVRFVRSPEIDDLLRVARDQALKEANRKTVEEAIRTAKRSIADCRYEPAIELLESTLRRIDDNQLRVILNETRRLSEDFQRDLQAAIAKTEQFLRDGAADRAVEFLDAQPETYARSPEFGALVEAARKQQVVEAVERQLAGEPDLDRQIKILENARKKYPTHADWEQTLQAVQERRKLVLNFVQQAKKFERDKRYNEALQEWLQVREVHEQYPGLAREIDRVSRLEEEARVRAIAAAQMKAVGQRQSSGVGVLTPPPVMPSGPEGGVEADRKRPPSDPGIYRVPPRAESFAGAEELPAAIGDEGSSWLSNRRNIVVGGAIAAVLIVGVSIGIFSHSHKTPPVPSTEPAPLESAPSPGSQPPSRSTADTNAPTPAVTPATTKPGDQNESVTKTNPPGGMQLAAKRETVNTSTSKANSNRSTVLAPPSAGKSTPPANPVSSLTPPVTPAQPGGATVNPSASTSQSSTPAAADSNAPAQPQQPVLMANAKPPDTPSVINMSPDKKAIFTALDHYREAYESESLDELQKVWPNMNKNQKKALKSAFESAQAVKVQLDCGDPSVSGDGATVKCQQSVRYTIAGKVQPSQTDSVDIVLNRSNGNWLVKTVRAN
jgi:eukaryotic-like serine/threonine-protein kinase